MAIRHLTAQDIDPNEKAKRAKSATATLKGRLSDPTLTPVQREEVKKALAKVEAWGA